MHINEVGTDAELLTVERPCACHASTCKCCCYQTAYVTSGGNAVGRVTETCYICVPEFVLYDASGRPTYILHQPTCCGGTCVNCCTEGNPCCGRGYCKVPFWIFAVQHPTEYAGKILKKPKSLSIELFTNASAFEVHFPTMATVEEKAVLLGATVFLNAVFFERGDNAPPT